MSEIKYNLNTAGNFKLLGYATGCYSGKCLICGEKFIGDKRAMQCLGCAIKAVESRPDPLQEVVEWAKENAYYDLEEGGEVVNLNNLITKIRVLKGGE